MLSSMDSDLESFSHNPTNNSFVELASQAASDNQVSEGSVPLVLTSSIVAASSSQVG